MVHFRHSITAAVAVLSVLALSACSSDEAARADDDKADEIRPGVTTEETEDGYLIEHLDTEGDGHPDIVRHVERYTDPHNPDRQRRRIRQLEIDVTGDQQFNVRRYYDEHGNLSREENDLSLDGQIDTILYYSGGELTRKEFYDDTGDYVEERRIYYDGNLTRVETDHNGDGNIDRWEYYEDGVLTRIGRDTVGDGAADTWQLR